MPSRTSSTSRRMPSCWSRRRGRRHVSATSRTSSGTIGTSQSHHERCQSFHSCCRLTSASRSWRPITTATAGAASSRDSRSAWRSASALIAGHLASRSGRHRTSRFAGSSRGRRLVHLRKGSRNDPSLRQDRHGAAAAVRPGSGWRGSGAGAARREVRRDVDLPQLHVPVVQLPRPAGRASVLRPDREHRGRGVRPYRARRGGDQHDAHGRVADAERPLEGRRREAARSRASRASATRSTSSPAARARCRRTRTAAPGTATTSSPPATSSRI